MRRKRFDRSWKWCVLVAISLIALGTSIWAWRSIDSKNRHSGASVTGEGSAINGGSPVGQREESDVAEAAGTSTAAPESRTSGGVSVDSKRVRELDAALNSGPVDEQIEAINLFARIGTPEQKAAIAAEAMKRDADVAVRIAAVENIDWRQQVDVVTDIIRNEPELGEATLYMAAEKDLPPDVVNRVAETAAPLFQTSTEPSFQLAVLNFFIEHHLDGFANLVPKANTNRYSDSEIADLNQLIATWNSETGSGQDASNPN